MKEDESMNEQQVRDYAARHLAGLEPSRKLRVSEEDALWSISFSDEEGNSLGGGYVFFVQKSTGDVVDMTRLGSGSGFNALSSCMDKFHEDADFRELLTLLRIIVGNVLEDTYVN